MNILVTGGAGFIGSHTIERLLTIGHRIICIDNFDDFYDPETKRQNLMVARRHPGFRLVEGDIRNREDLERCFAAGPVESVIHLAARAGVRPSLRQPELYFDVNVRGTLSLLEAMREHAVKRLLFASSSSVYGNSARPSFSEDDNVDYPVSPYAASKKAAELICHTYHHLYNFDIYCLRFFTVYGTRQRPEMAIHQFTRRILSGEPITLFGDGHSFRDYTYIEDILDGIVRALDALRGFEIVNLGESRSVTLNDLVSMIENITGKKAVIRRQPSQPGDVEATRASIEKAKRLFGYAPVWKIEQGLEQFVEWLKTTTLVHHEE
jgi:UDP-glucuronate 4-epimerase